VKGKGTMRHWRSTALAGLVLFMSAVTTLACTEPADLAGLRTETLERVNAERLAAGLTALARSDRLERAAQDHACYIARSDRLSHRGSFGTSLRVRLLRVGYRFAMANENLASGLDTPAQVIAGWMGSTAHRANILAGGSRDFGLGAARARGGRVYWVMVSARLR